jgi:plasmid stabilization system protein ParE
MPGEYRVHRSVLLDLKNAESHYFHEAGEVFADRFIDETFSAFQLASDEPLRAHIDLVSKCRRVNLKTFPYHFLYDPYPGYIHILVLRHNKRHPAFGLRRKR